MERHVPVRTLSILELTVRLLSGDSFCLSSQLQGYCVSKQVQHGLKNGSVRRVALRRQEGPQYDLEDPLASQEYIQVQGQVRSHTRPRIAGKEHNEAVQFVLELHLQG